MSVSQMHHRTAQNQLFFLSFTQIDWLTPSVVTNIFCVTFSSLSFDSVILPLIVSAGQLTKMATPPCMRITVTTLHQQKGRCGKHQGEIKYSTHPSPPEVPDLSFSLFSLFFCLSAHKVIGKHTTIFFC